MSSALRRRLSALQNLTESRGATPGEPAAAQLAIERIRARLRASGQALEWDEQSQPDYDSPSHPGPSRRRARRKASHERPARTRLHMGDLIDCDMIGHPIWGPCGSCKGKAFQVCPGIDGLAAAMLVCLGPGCRRARRLRREHFMEGGRWAD
jgi:hypothetical protein